MHDVSNFTHAARQTDLRPRLHGDAAPVVNAGLSTVALAQRSRRIETGGGVLMRTATDCHTGQTDSAERRRRASTSMPVLLGYGW